MGRMTGAKRSGHMMKALLSLVGVLTAAAAINLLAGRCIYSSCSQADRAPNFFWSSISTSSSDVADSIPQNRRIGPADGTAEEDQPLQASLLVQLASGLQQKPMHLPAALDLLKQQQQQQQQQQDPEAISRSNGQQMPAAYMQQQQQDTAVISRSKGQQERGVYRQQQQQPDIAAISSNTEQQVPAVYAQQLQQQINEAISGYNAQQVPAAYPQQLQQQQQKQDTAATSSSNGQQMPAAYPQQQQQEGTAAISSSNGQQVPLYYPQQLQPQPQPQQQQQPATAQDPAAAHANTRWGSWDARYALLPGPSPDDYDTQEVSAPLVAPTVAVGAPGATVPPTVDIPGSQPLGHSTPLLPDPLVTPTVPHTVDILGSQYTREFLQQLLLTANYTQLGAAPFVDSLVAARDLVGMQDMMRQQQQLFCSAGLHQLPLNGTQQLVVQGIKLHVYSNADAVTDSLKVNQGWEHHVVNQLHWAVQQYKSSFKQQKGMLGRGGLQAAAAFYKPPLVVDVGANMGWIMLSAAAQGARVIAFEGMPMNYLLLRRTLCDNPDIMSRVTLFAAGLSNRSQDCSVVSLRNNQGNGNVLCGPNLKTSMKELAAREPGVYEVRGTMSLRRLDDLLDEDVHLLKVDVEGWEEAVLQGAARLLAQKRVKYIITEANSQLRSRASLLAFMRYLYESGFNISYNGFQGPFISEEQVYDKTAPQPSWDVFCVLRTASQQLQQPSQHLQQPNVTRALGFGL